MSATRLLVLGVVRLYGQAHGYQVRRELSTWNAETWANVKPGSIYHALKQLTKTAMVRSVGVESGDQGPERTSYELTEDGETEFGRLLREALSNPEVKPEMWGAGITFFPCLDRARAVTLLRYRVANLEACRQSLTGFSGSESPLGKPAHVAELFHWWVAEYTAAIEFSQALIARLESGAYTMADDAGDAFEVNAGANQL